MIPWTELKLACYCKSLLFLVSKCTCGIVKVWVTSLCWLMLQSLSFLLYDLLLSLTTKDRVVLSSLLSFIYITKGFSSSWWSDLETIMVRWPCAIRWILQNDVKVTIKHHICKQTGSLVDLRNCGIFKVKNLSHYLLTNLFQTHLN